MYLPAYGSSQGKSPVEVLKKDRDDLRPCYVCVGAQGRLAPEERGTIVSTETWSFLWGLTVRSRPTTDGVSPQKEAPTTDSWPEIYQVKALINNTWGDTRGVRHLRHLLLYFFPIPTPETEAPWHSSLSLTGKNSVRNPFWKIHARVQSRHIVSLFHQRQ